MKHFVLILKFIVGLLVLLVWTLAGTLLYVPLLTRQIAVYSLALSAASLGRGTIDRAQQALERAIEFLPRGYSLALRVVFSGPSVAEAERRSADKLDMGRLLGEVVWSIVFWGITVTLLFFRHVIPFLRA